MELSAREKYDGSLLIWMEIKLTFHAHQGVRDYPLHKYAMCFFVLPSFGEAIPCTSAEQYQVVFL